jgi:hypothetical protein
MSFSVIVSYISPPSFVLILGFLYYSKISITDFKHRLKNLEKDSITIREVESFRKELENVIESLSDDARKIQKIDTDNAFFRKDIVVTISNITKIIDDLSKEVSKTSQLQSNKKVSEIEESLATKFKELKSAFMLNSEKIEQIHEIIRDHEKSIQELNIKLDSDILNEKWINITNR